MSTATIQVTEEDLQQMLVHYRRNNLRDNITGLLLYSGENYVQLIEGANEDLQRLFTKIQKDHLHQNITKLADGEIGHRLFSDWSMGFKTLSANALARFKGYVNPTGTDFLNFLPAEEEDSAISVLQQFAQHNLADISYQ